MANNKNNKVEFDKNEIFSEKIKPLLEQANKLAAEHGIPIIMVAQPIYTHENGSLMRTSATIPEYADPLIKNIALACMPKESVINAIVQLIKEDVEAQANSPETNSPGGSS